MRFNIDFELLGAMVTLAIAYNFKRNYVSRTRSENTFIQMVYFILGSKYAQTTATLIDDKTLTFITPVFSEPSFINPGTRFQGTKDCEVYIKIDNEELSTNPIKFSIYYDTNAGKSIFFGPACITGGTPGVPTSLLIRARNDENENRLSGLDNFEVSVVSENDMTKSIETKIVDQNDGTY